MTNFGDALTRKSTGHNNGSDNRSIVILTLSNIPGWIGEMTQSALHWGGGGGGRGWLQILISNFTHPSPGIPDLISEDSPRIHRHCLKRIHNFADLLVL